MYLQAAVAPDDPDPISSERWSELSRCAWCSKTIWPWQKPVHDIAGPEHKPCWRARYEHLEAHGGLPANSRYFWEALLMAPPEISRQMLERYDTKPTPATR